MAAPFIDEFVPNIQAAPYHAKWKSANKNENQKWEAYRDACIAYKKGKPTPVVPVMATKYGRALVAAGKDHMSVIDLGAVWPTTPQPSNDPEPPVWNTGTLTINTGGTYAIAQQSVIPGQPAVIIATTQPVVLTGWARNLTGGGGALIDALVAGLQLTVQNLWAYGKYIVPNNESPTRFLWTQNHASLTVQNCTFRNTSGMEINASLAGSSLLVTKNRCTNIQGYVDNPAGILRVGNFIQFRQVQSGTQVVSWNEVLNEYNKSWPEDIISCIRTANLTISNNYLGHNSTPGNAYNTSSQGTITLESGSPATNNVSITNNQMVDTVNGIFIGSGCQNVTATGNRLIQDGKLPDGVTQMGNGYSGMSIQAGCTNCHMHANTVGFVNRDGARVDWFPMDGAPEGSAAEIANNTTLADPITLAMEQTEFTSWQAKLAANGITVGAA